MLYVRGCTRSYAGLWRACGANLNASPTKCILPVFERRQAPIQHRCMDISEGLHRFRMLNGALRYMRCNMWCCMRDYARALQGLWLCGGCAGAMRGHYAGLRGARGATWRLWGYAGLCGAMQVCAGWREFVPQTQLISYKVRVCVHAKF